MDDKSSLIEQLRIERPAEVEPVPRWPIWIAGVVAVVVVAAAAAWAFWPRGVPVRAATAELAPADVAVGPGSILDASGYVVARRQATVSAKITGKVVRVTIEEGQRVARDEIIARLDDTNARAAVDQARAQLAQADANYTAARVAFDNAVPTFKRNEQQLEKAVISAQTFDTAKAAYDAARTSLDVAARAVEVARATVAFAERNLEDTVVRAPFAGVVTVKAAQEGEMVSPNSAGGGFTRTGIGTIVDMDSLEIEVDVSENFINRVRPDQKVTARLNAYPDWAIPAHVIAIIPTADRAKATVKVRIGFDARDDRILPEMGVRVAFLEAASTQPESSTPSSAQRPLVVPPDAVQAAGDTGFVFVLDGDRVERRSVRLGGRVAGGQVVLSGLTAGTRVAAGDTAKLEDGAKVRVEN
ncbi:MAG TPA: efflux RND transporter periplasmic adaptor subunit [Gammaproteobacteria bacterium]|nr:efflux RND transporter periplasmic adaptor subunit [Gammaproteobacteria bacterium]